MTRACEIRSRAWWTLVTTRRTSRPDWSDSDATERLGLDGARPVRARVRRGRPRGDAPRRLGAGRVLPVGPAPVMVAPGRVARGHDVLDRHAEPRHRPRAHRRRGPELGLVGLCHHRDLHGVLLRQAVAAVSGAHRYRVLRAAL